MKHDPRAAKALPTPRFVGIAIGVGVLLAAVLAGPPAQARTKLVVDDDGRQCRGADFATIGQALAAAADGDVIEVCPGLYREELVVSKTVRIAGPVAAVRRFDCFAAAPSEPTDLDTTRFAVLQSPLAPGEDTPGPLVTLDADRAELEGLVIQGVEDVTAPTDESGAFTLFAAAVSTTDAHSGYRLHHNLIRLNTLGIELGSSGASPSSVEENCFRDNEFAVANQRWGLRNAHLEDNVTFRTSVIAYEIGWGYRATSDVVLEDNTLRDDAFAVRIENAARTRVADNEIAFRSRGIDVLGGNAGLEISDNTITGGTTVRTFPTGVQFFTPAAGTSRSTDVVVEDNSMSGIATTNAAGALVGAGIGVGTGALDDARIIDNDLVRNGQAGITILNGNRGNLIADNLATDNQGYGIRVQGTASAGNLFEDNRMLRNGLADARDDTDADPGDGIQLLNTWIDNQCETDIPAGAICGR